jgi:hypothetical protein
MSVLTVGGKMEGRFTERETGAEYHVRELSDGTVVWVGEDVSGTGIKILQIFFSVAGLVLPKRAVILSIFPRDVATVYLLT